MGPTHVSTTLMGPRKCGSPSYGLPHKGNTYMWFYKARFGLCVDMYPKLKQQHFSLPR